MTPADEQPLRSDHSPADRPLDPDEREHLGGPEPFAPEEREGAGARQARVERESAPEHAAHPPPTSALEREAHPRHGAAPTAGDVEEVDASRPTDRTEQKREPRDPQSGDEVLWTRKSGRRPVGSVPWQSATESGAIDQPHGRAGQESSLSGGDATRVQTNRDSSPGARQESYLGEELAAARGRAGQPRRDAPETPAEPPAPVGRQGGPPAARRRWAVAAGVVLLVAAVAGTATGMAVARPGWLLGAPAEPGQAQPSYVIDTQATPAPTRRPAVPAASPVPAADYTVGEGDTLRSIADSVYGDADLWPTLYDANRDTIGADPDSLRVGMHLKVPAR